MEAMTLVVRMLPSIGSTRGEEICWERANTRLTTFFATGQTHLLASEK
jgi:hypothetical protein